MGRPRLPWSAAFALVVTTLPLACGLTEPSETEAEFWARMEAFVTERMDAQGSGFGIAVLHEGNIAYARGWGMANIETGVPFSPDTPSDAASLTKQFTATAILMLYEQELFTLETPIRSLLPELPDAWADVTVHHLLTHQSGIPNYTDITGDDPAAIDGLTNQAALDLVLANPALDFPAGTSTSYSNTGYLLLAMLVERLSGASFGEYLRTNIFDPLGMSSTFVNDGSTPHPPNAARPYDAENRLYEYTLHTYGAGGIYTTLNDYAKWDRALYTADLLPQSTLELAFRGYTGGANDFGYGWMVGNHRGSKSLRHGGFSTGILNYVVRVPGKRFTYLFFSNGGVFANDGFDTWTNELMEEIYDYYL
ncbi:MAG: serine hydrolase [Gemmatimonadales bacterium]|nr:serine hydrolase [Gemmatimonadales bacterium]NIN12379.1 serine hydrolase [Gemmatimonadales bacterium]NIN48917.1 serine hydrolase [Gemmatimonadales bacterium]NIP06381.1 serine hydrolase [Gemmatimonadales bacterium]NIR00754.1 serine hydrolase [Gemmatimonadales bacterium]